MQATIRASESAFLSIRETRLKVSRVALDTWLLGGREKTDIPRSIATIRAALDQGINLIDTAPVFGFGMAERILGAALEGRRKQAIIATKTGLEWRSGAVRRNATRARIMQEIDDSLRRLRTDYIDIYQVHWPDPWVPVEETAEAMRLLYQQGKIRAIGVSNFSVAEMERFRHVAPLHLVQSHYGLFERAAEGEVLLRYCQGNDIVTVGSCVLCRGLLSGRVRTETAFRDDALRRIDANFHPAHFAQYRGAVRQLDELARRRFHRRVVQLAARWMLDQGIGVALWGSRHPAQVEAALGVSGWSLDSASQMLIERTVKEAIVGPAGREFIRGLQRARRQPKSS
jgi:aryl-alcohol dehydrogenase-like predicted oxidoreductase